MHGEADLDASRAPDRAQVAKNRSIPTADALIASVDSTVRSSETVQILSDKNSENNGCTVGSSIPPVAASHLASEDNFFASLPPAHAKRTERAFIFLRKGLGALRGAPSSCPRRSHSDGYQAYPGTPQGQE